MAAKTAGAKNYTELTIGSLFDEVQRAVDSICRRAYEFAAERAFAGGHDLNDWLKAENELFFVPASELTETETEYTLKVAVSGFKPDQIAVSAEPQCVTVWGNAATGQVDVPDTEAESQAVGNKEMFCQYRLSHPVVVENAKALYESGDLTVTLPKRNEPQEADTEHTEQPAAA